MRKKIIPARPLPNKTVLVGSGTALPLPPPPPSGVPGTVTPGTVPKEKSTFDTVVSAVIAELATVNVAN